jgi:hypothetical protein
MNVLERLNQVGPGFHTNREAALAAMRKARALPSTTREESLAKRKAIEAARKTLEAFK